MTKTPAHREQAVVPTPAITTHTEGTAPKPEKEAEGKKNKSSDKE